MLFSDFLNNGVSVGEVAGFISGALSMMHLTLPLFLAVVLIGVIQDEKHNAATWSLISNQLQNSLWPFLLQSDSSKTRHVRWRVTLISWLLVFGTFAAIVASFMTPQPLAGGTTPERALYVADFQYARDSSYFGLGTPERIANSVNRLCGYFAWMNCPETAFRDPSGDPVFYYNGSYLYGSQYEEAYVNFTVVNSTISEKTAERFSSGTKGTTIAGPMDIQYRNYHISNNPYVDQSETLVYGGFEPLQILMLDDAYRIVEGAVVDTINGGIGFRNHTVPIDLPLGATWTEDILFVTPTTSCVNTNISLRFSIDPYVWFNQTDAHIVDDGGIANLDPNVPQPSWADGIGDLWQDTGEVPDLYARAYTAAWWNNHFTAYVLGLTESEVGASYSAGADWWYQSVSSSAIKISNMNGWYINGLGDNATYAESNDFTAYGRRCAGFDDSSPANASKPFIRCGYLYGIPSPEDGGQFWHVDPGTKWKIPLYTCASAMKASVKSITFLVNSTNPANNSLSLDSLAVVSIEDKTYPSKSAEPLWAVEKPAADTYKIRDINLFWGIVNESFVDENIMRVTRAPELYLPAVGFYNSLGYDSDGFAAGSMGIAFSAVFANAAPGPDITESQHWHIPNYSGSENFGLALKYRELSQTSDGAARIMNLIWTDLATWSFVGTKTGFEADQSIADSPRTQTSSLGTRGVYKYKRSVSYRDFRYAIPAFVTGLIWFFAFLATLFLFLFRIVHWDTLNHYVNQTTMGRTFTNLSNPGITDPTAKASKWHDSAGKLILNVPDSKARQIARIRSSTSSTAGLTAGGRYTKIGTQKEFSDSDVELLQRGLSGQTMMSPESYSPYYEHQRRFSVGGPVGVGSSAFGPLCLAKEVTTALEINIKDPLDTAPSSSFNDGSLGRKVTRKPVPRTSPSAYSAISPQLPYSEIRPYSHDVEFDMGDGGEGDYAIPDNHVERRPGFHHQDSFIR